MKKSFRFSVIGILLITALFFVLKNKKNPTSNSSVKQYYSLNGQTMGTYFNIKAETKYPEKLSKSIDSLLVVFNNSLSTYIPGSTVSKFNQSDTSYQADSFLKVVFKTSKVIYNTSDGAFDPTVMPLVNAWGFGFKNKENITNNLIDSLIGLVGLNKVFLDEKGLLHKEDQRIMLDFSAIAKGYGVDVVSEFIEKMGVENYLVEIGGEVRVKGVNQNGQNWVIAIEEPDESIESQKNRKIFEKLSLQNKSVATSGNYRKFYIDDQTGKKYAHTIDPHTGFPVQHNLLSATVVYKNCMVADAYATAFMVIGVEEALKLAENIKDLEAFFIYQNDVNEIDVAYSSGFPSLFSKPADLEE
jgi:thiamine biosynthesis lipoprotein